MQRETELVVTLCRAPLRDGERQRIAALLDHTVEWPLFFAKVASGGVEPLVLFNLNRSFGESLPAEVRQRSAALEKNARARALANTLVLIDVVERLRVNGIDSLVLKGPAIGIAAYDDPSLRAFSDIDLLVRRDDVPAARDLLLALDYEPNFEAGAESATLDAGHALEFNGARMKVELHTVLVSRHLRFRIDDDRLWQSARDTDCAGKTFRTLGAAEHFLFLCAHGAKHEWERLSWVSDIAHLARKLSSEDCRAVVALARAAHGERLLALAVRLARDVFGEANTPLDDFLTEAESNTAALVTSAKRRIGLEPHGAHSNVFLDRLHPNLRPLIYWSRARERRIDRLGSLARLLLQRVSRSVIQARVRGATQ